MDDERDDTQPRGYRGTTGRTTQPFRSTPDQRGLQRSRQARQILSGAQIRPPNRALSSYPAPASTFTQPQMLYGAALGFLAYATYDLTNLATLKDWPLRVAMLDIAWGTAMTGVAASVGAWVTLRLGR